MPDYIDSERESQDFVIAYNFDTYYHFLSERLDNLLDYTNQFWSYYKDNCSDIFILKIELALKDNKFFFHGFQDNFYKFVNNKDHNLVNKTLDIKYFWSHAETKEKTYFVSRDQIITGHTFMMSELLICLFSSIIIIYTEFVGLDNNIKLQINYILHHYIPFFLLPLSETLYYFFNSFINYENLYFVHHENWLDCEKEFISGLGYYVHFIYIFGKQRDPLFDYNNILSTSIKPILFSNGFFHEIFNLNFIYDMINFMRWVIVEDIFITKMYWINLYNKTVALILVMIIVIVVNIITSLLYKRNNIDNYNYYWCDHRYIRFVAVLYKLNKRNWNVYFKRIIDFICKK